MDKTNRKELTDAYKARKITGGVFIIKNTVTGKSFLAASTDMKGSRNRFEFSQSTNTPYNLKLAQDHAKYGGSSFIFEELELLDQKQDQTPKQFKEDVELLCEMWQEKFKEDELY